MLAVGLVYLGAARAGGEFSLLYNSVSSVWPASGVAVAALLLWGMPCWPGIFLGALLANLSFGVPLPACVGMATGNTLEAVLAVLLLRRLGFSATLERVQDVVALTGVAAVGATLVAALMGTTSLGLVGVMPWARFAETVFVWWGGDAVGIVVMTPVLLLLRQWRSVQRRAEAVALGGCTLLVCAKVFLGGTLDPSLAYAEAFLFFPLTVWAALRFGTRGVACTAVLLAALSIWGTVEGNGPFATSEPARNLLLVQLFTAINAVTGLLLAAASAATQELRARLVAAERVAALGTLAAAVGHEINNPLNYLELSLVAAARRLGQGMAGQAEALAYVHGAQEGAERIRRIVEDLRMFSREGAEDHRPVELRAVVMPALRMMRHLLHGRARLVEDHGPSPRVLGSEARLGQVLLNLLVNAAQAIPEGAPERNEVRIRTSTAPDGRARVEISDTGRGIPPDVLPRIFEPFFTTRTSEEGTGLGLSICQQIVRAHGGELHVHSEPGNGSVFTVLLPAAPPGEALQAAPARPRPEQARPSSGAARRGRILIIDDEPRLAQSMRLLLEPTHDVVTATHGSEALELVSAGQRFDVVVCDLQMPGTTGMDIYARLREQEPELARRLVFISGGACTPAARQFIRTVPNRVLEKPIRPEVLLATIDAALEPAAPWASP
ncbi:MAG: MASE1 domain-containing protein [Myxococcaceae bacterium]|nr:MASE1 domain-containing protein [Myxococcaceae bacterium]